MGKRVTELAADVSGPVTEGSPHGRPPVGQRGLTGVLAVALAVGCSRWGSYLGRAPTFLTDVLILIAVVNSLLFGGHVSKAIRDPGTPTGVVLLWIYGGYGLAELAAHQDFSITALRDAAPYIYSLLGGISGATLWYSTKFRRQRAASWLLAALTIHTVWFFIVEVLYPSLPLHLPLVSSVQSLHVLSPRPDFDTAVTGVFAAWSWLQVLRGRRRALNVCLLVMSIAAIFGTPSRAGLVGALTAILLGGAVALGNGWVSRRAQGSILIALLAATAAAVVLLPHTTVGARLSGNLSSSPASIAAAGAQGTTRAREAAWQSVIGYTDNSAGRLLAGVGFGPDFMQESGADFLLVGSSGGGTTDPRSPHNYWIGTFARLGILGVALFGLIVALMLLRVKRLLRHTVSSPLLFFACAIPVALLVPASLGVVLESPFGAVPFFWCAGIVFAYGEGQLSPKPTGPPGFRAGGSRPLAPFLGPAGDPRNGTTQAIRRRPLNGPS